MAEKDGPAGDSARSTTGMVQEGETLFVGRIAGALP